MATNTNEPVRYGYGPATTIRSSSNAQQKRCPYCKKLHMEDSLFCSRRCRKLDESPSR